jgi:ribulose 1,5-bisphosphate synthetase/thiazole synthase
MDEIKISRAIVNSYKEKILDALDVDVATVGAGPVGKVEG